MIRIDWSLPGHFCIGVIVAAVDEHETGVGTIGFIGPNEKAFQMEGFSIVKIDEVNDLCLIAKPAHGLMPVQLAEDSTVRIHDAVYTVGAPTGTFPIETHGYVSLPEIESQDSELNGKMLLSLSIYSGNSGSPVYNGQGKVIAVIVMGSRAYTSIAIATSVKALRSFLEAY